ncbi:MAG TPA: DUF2905 domain-containing protein [Desulfobulbus sp.]|nr:DUF2905 domain-containing protein [Desulfobulbus sp.]
MGRIFIYCGIGLVATGLLWPWLRHIPLGRLPGDLVIEKENFRLYFPLTSSILVSLLLSFLFYLFRK